MCVMIRITDIEQQQSQPTPHKDHQQRYIHITSTKIFGTVMFEKWEKINSTP